MKTVMKHIVISLLLGVYLITTSIGRIEVFKLELCSPDAISHESSSSKPKTIDPRPSWNSRRQISTKINIQIPADEAITEVEKPNCEQSSFVSLIHEFHLQHEVKLSDSSPRSPPLV